MGKGEKEKAVYYLGNAAVLLFTCGLVLCLITQFFLEPMLRFFGSPENVLEYAKTYTRIVSVGFPFLILTTGGGHLIRADGRPEITMVCKTVTIRKEHLVIHKEQVERIASLGAAPCTNQISMMIVQIVMNKSLKYYGGLSLYGEAIPIACAGIISKVNMLFMSFIIGISQGLQPIVSFNYGARRYARVKKAYLQAITCGIIMSVLAFCLFQFAPRQIISIFGQGSEEYYRFAIQYFKVFLFFTFVNFMQPISSNFFTAIGKPKRGIWLSLTRQIIFLLPFLVIFPLFLGIDGIMYAGPIADLMAAIVGTIMVWQELKRKEYHE